MSRLALLIAAAGALSACGSMFGAMPEKLGGLPASAPERPAETMPYQPVYQQRPKREAVPLNDEEQKKLETELSTLRETQKQRVDAPYPPPEPPPPPLPAAKAAAPAPVKAAGPAPAPAKKADAKAAPKPPDGTKKKQNEAVVPEQKGPAAPLKLVN